MIKYRQDNDMAYDENQIGQWCDWWYNRIYDKNETKLSWSIKSGTVCDENKTEQWWDQSIGLVYVETEIELLGPIWLGEI